MKSFNADICLMAYVLLFVPQPVLDAPRLGTFQYHPSLLPAHRGPSSINWPIAMGKTRTGLTIFWPDEGLDEGPVLIAEIGRDRPRRHARRRLLQEAVPDGRRRHDGGLDLVKAGVAAQAQAGPRRWLLRELVQEGHRRARLVEAGGRQSTTSSAPPIRRPAPGRYQGHQARHLSTPPRSPAAASRQIIAIRRQGITIAGTRRRHPRQARARRPTARRSPPPSGRSRRPHGRRQFDTDAKRRV